MDGKRSLRNSIRRWRSRWNGGSQSDASANGKTGLKSHRDGAATPTHSATGTSIPIPGPADQPKESESAAGREKAPRPTATSTESEVTNRVMPTIRKVSAQTAQIALDDAPSPGRSLEHSLTPEYIEPPPKSPRRGNAVTAVQQDCQSLQPLQSEATDKELTAMESSTAAPDPAPAAAPTTPATATAARTATETTSPQQDQEQPQPEPPSRASTPGLVSAPTASPDTPITTTTPPITAQGLLAKSTITTTITATAAKMEPRPSSRLRLSFRLSGAEFSRRRVDV